ncbi:hypothetical protein HY345_03385 [Candidatus Microgenomates bacterium]|nr:hypothetical protein [Candidatus Microgenomates bacterium]
MQINVADQRILLFSDQLTPEEAKQKSWEKKTMAFDAISKVTSFLSRPKDEDFELVYQEHRYQPFWHVVAKARYVYERTADYQVEVSGPEVKAVTLQKTKYEVTNGHFHTSVLEHCQQDEEEEVFVSGVSGHTQPELRKYLSLSPTVVKGKLEKSVPEGSILVPPQARVSAIMRDSLSKMIKGIQADKILEEEVKVECVDLYYRPVYAFQYRWKSKGKEGIIEIDGLTGEFRSGNRTFKEYFGKVLDQDFLFDLGADAAGILIPGGSIAVKVAKKYIDNKKGK